MLASLAIVLMSATTGAAPAAPVSVDLAGSTVTLRILAPLSLDGVLLTLCDKTGAECDPLPTLSSWPLLPPMTVTGTWESVVDGLMAESGLGYAAVPPAPGRPARLIIEASAFSGAPNERQSEANRGPREDTASALVPEEEPSWVADDDGQDHETAALEVEPEVPRSLASIPALVGGAPPAESPAAQTVSTPLVGPSGESLRVSLPSESADETSPGWVATPFSDQMGDPLTLPETSEVYPVAPFSDPDGQPIPTELGPANPTLEYPIPATPLRPPEPRPEPVEAPAGSATESSSGPR